jgi:hypothetical protein
MLASIAQGGDYKVLGGQAKPLHGVNDVRSVLDNCLCRRFQKIQLELSRVQ